MPATTIFDVEALTPTFQDDFSTGTLDTLKWTASDYVTPGAGVFDPAYVLLNQGMLCLALTQSGDDVANSVGGEISSNQPFSYGVFQWDARMSSNTTTPFGAGTSMSGQISGLFTYTSDPEPGANELDFELEGQFPCQLEVGSWVGEASHEFQYVNFPQRMHSDFHRYSVWWTPGKLRFYYDGFLIYTNTTNVPTVETYFFANHWAGDGFDYSFGGLATFNVTRRLYVRNMRYWRQEDLE